VITVALLTSAALAIDHAAIGLLEDVRLAMKRADLTSDWVARSIDVPPQKLSDQLLGKAPFTAWWRFSTAALDGTDFWDEFLDLRAKRRSRALVRTDLWQFIAAVREVVLAREDMRYAVLDAVDAAVSGARKPMAKAALAPQALGGQKVQAV
jgi:hypothetical protein